MSSITGECSEAAPAVQSPLAPEPASAGAYWTLSLLFAANLFNYIDRNIIAIIGTGIQRDLQISDADLGFLMGTAFATFYGVVGIGMGRIADVVSRTRLLGAGLAIWSGVTALSGLAFNFATLALTRTGVGVGEAIAGPCAQSLISDQFPARNRSFALSILLVAAPLGGALSFALGGALMGNWPQICGTIPGNACALADWQATFMIVGTPGLLLAVLVALRPEPRPRPSKIPLARIVRRELGSSLPPFTFFNIFHEGGVSALFVNFKIVGGVLAAAAMLIVATGDWAQWIAIAIGVYSVVTWGQVLYLRDRPLYRLTFGSPTARLSLLGGAMAGAMSVTMGSWAAPYAMRVLHAPPGQIGMLLGGATIIGSIIGTLAGGYITDRWKRRDPRAPIWMALFSLYGPALPLALMLSTSHLYVFAVGSLVFSMLALAWAGGYAALVQESVLPRMRATAAALFALVVHLIAAGIGPYMVGKVSTLTGSLTLGLTSLLVALPLGTIFLVAAARRTLHETAEMRAAWAVESGEHLPAGPKLQAG